MRVIRRDIIFFDDSGGGVTFSGGEPLLWPDFLESTLAACKAEGIHTAVDTCGYAQSETVARIASQADLFLFDLKLIDSARHKEATGVNNEIILANLAMLVREGKRVIVRMPVVPGINDDRENVEATMDFLAGIGVRRIDLLPYHDIGAGKYQRLQAAYRLTELRPPSADQMQDLSDRFKKRDFTVHIGG
jgi:pyruvate formate lyase activating enzyme